MRIKTTLLYSAQVLGRVTFFEAESSRVLGFFQQTRVEWSTHGPKNPSTRVFRVELSTRPNTISGLTTDWIFLQTEK